jgi:hypothetical protein
MAVAGALVTGDLHQTPLLQTLDGDGRLLREN